MEVTTWDSVKEICKKSIEKLKYCGILFHISKYCDIHNPEIPLCKLYYVTYTSTASGFRYINVMIPTLYCNSFFTLVGNGNLPFQIEFVGNHVICNCHRYHD